MNSRGVNNQATVANRGLTCAFLGYVELKHSSTGGDTCLTDQSWWGTSYNSDYLYLSGQSKDTYVCGQQALCQSSNIQWSGVGTIYVSIVEEISKVLLNPGLIHVEQFIFRPEGQAAPATVILDGNVPLDENMPPDERVLLNQNPEL